MSLRKITLMNAMIGLLSISIFAYNPPVNGENLFELTSPQQIAGASSIAGGGIKNVNSSSVVINPALIAGEQRWSIDVDYTALVDFSGTENYGQAMQAGLIMPSRFGVGTVILQGVFADTVESLPLGNTFTIRTAFAKDITDELYLGVGLYGGFGSDWALAGDIGFWYNIKQLRWLPFLQDIRWAVSLTGMGKSYSNPYLGLDGTQSSEYPAPFTPRVGIAGNLFSTSKFSGGLSLDLSFPTFQNVVFDAGLQFLIADIVHISTGWEANLQEILADKASLIPTIGISVKFSFTSKDDSFLTRKGWQQSQAVVSSAYQAFDSGINAISASLNVQLGQKDLVPPEIILWEEE